MIAENAFGVFFIITKLFLGCIWHEKKKKSQAQIHIQRAMQWTFKTVFHGEGYAMHPFGGPAYGSLPVRSDRHRRFRESWGFYPSGPFPERGGGPLPKL